MRYSYTTRKQVRAKTLGKAPSPQGPSMDALRTGAVHPTQEQLGHRVDLPEVMRAKMENAFGADLSGVKLYESQAVGDAGANAITQGSNIAFAPGMLDFTSFGGQALLGHEISHVVSQARGEVTGSGFLNDHALEARADREGAMAASGRSVAMPAAAMSAVTAAPSAGPMQADKKPKKGSSEEEEGIELQNFAEKPKPDPRVPKSNGAYESFIGALVDQKDTVSTFTDPLSDLDEVKKSVAGSMQTARTVEKIAGSVLKNKALQQGILTDYASDKAEKVIQALKDKGVEPVAKKIGNISGIVSSSAGVPQAMMKFGGAYKSLDKARRFGTEQELKDAKLDVASTGLGTLKKGNSLASTVAKQFQTTAAKTTGAVTKYLGTGLGIGAQGLSLFKNARRLKEASGRKSNMAHTAAAMQSLLDSNPSEEDQEKVAIFRQSERRAGSDVIENALNTTKDTLGLGSTVLGLAGVAPASTAFSFAQSLVGAVGDEVLSYEHDQEQKQTVEEKYHAKEKYYKAMREDPTFIKMGVTKRAFKRKLLKAKGAGSGSKEEAYQMLSSQRADKLLEGLKNKEDWAIEFANNAGIRHEIVGKSDEHDKAVRASLLKALNGGKEDEKFHSSDVREYNAFKEGAESQRKWNEDKRPLKEKVKDMLKPYKESAVNSMKDTWESVKTGSKNAVRGVARTASGAWKAMRTGAYRAKRFATSSEARSEAWKNFKTGASSAMRKAGTGLKNAGHAIAHGATRAYEGTKDFLTNADTRKAAWNSVKTGARNAARYGANVFKHSVRSRLHGVRDWYREGVDQMNAHGDTYKQMGALDRFLWSAKNLPARMTHGLKSNRAATEARTKENEDAEAAVAYLLQKEEEEKKQRPAPIDKL